MDVFESLIGHVSVNLGRGNGGVTEHRLDASNVGAVGQEVCSKTVAQSMRMNIFHNSGFGRIVFYDSLNTSLGDP